MLAHLTSSFPSTRPLLIILAFLPTTYLLFWLILLSIHLLSFPFSRVDSRTTVPDGIYSTRRMTISLAVLAAVIHCTASTYDICVVLRSWGVRSEMLAGVCEGDDLVQGHAWAGLVSKGLGAMAFWSYRNEQTEAEDEE